MGVHGLNVLGIMGEAHKLSEGERRRVAEAFVKSAAGRFPVVVGTSHGGTAVVTELSQAAEAAGAAAVMVAPPIGLRGEAVTSRTTARWRGRSRSRSWCRTSPSPPAS